MRWIVNKILKLYDRRKRYDIQEERRVAFFNGVSAGRQMDDINAFCTLTLTLARNYARDKLNDKYGDFEHEDGEWSELIKILDRSLK